ncbi:hypothetical protein MSG28_012384 [Choristoneura fumiferana]|uniref:Uncharacterized protein n=1 Tax=Choristoneura fumiferana TaxID=7141 RepID=A0ACC0KDM8_CHOFU|nr:hypothetical protein MSG28_012384 [Choristoneura fumiferana]
MDRNFDWDSIRNNAQRNSAHASNVEFLTSQLWINELNETLANMEGSGIEIIELDSMNNTQTSSEDPYENIQNFSHGWSYVSTNRFQELENSYKMNRQARLRRRLTNRNHDLTANDSLDSEFEDSFYLTDYKNSTIDSGEDVVKLNQQTNCFTILNKHTALNLGSSSEESDDPETEATRCGDIVLESEQYIDEVNYKSNPEEKHTIWIYSFKNRRLLAEKEFEMNIPCQSPSSSCSPEYVDEEINTDNISHVGRVASPIPKPCIPRLNLSLTATLPNVSEVSEPKTSPTFNKDQGYKIKAVNGWFLDNSEKHEYVSKHDKSTNIVNWMALSPREKRRRSRHTHLDIQHVAKLLPVSEIDSNAEVKSHDIEEKAKNTEIKTEKMVMPQIISQKSKSDQQTETKTTIESTMEDRGDYNKGGQRPHITFDRRQFVGSPITEPLDKLDGNNWIAEHEPKSRHEYDFTMDNDENQRASGDMVLASAGDRLMFRNMSLLKPAEWREYSPIAGSHLSLQLSLGPDSDMERTTFFQRCFSCFKCCKYKY